MDLEAQYTFQMIGLNFKAIEYEDWRLNAGIDSNLLENLNVDYYR